MIDNKIFKMSAKNIKNALGKDGEEFADGLIDLLDMMRQDEQTFTMEDVKAEVEKYLADKVVTEEKVEEVANALFAKKIAEVQNNLGGKKTDVKAIQNKVAKALVNSKSYEEFAGKAQKIANEISGITAPDVIDYAVENKWGNQAPFYAKLRQVAFNKFLYSDQDLTDANILAHKWDKTSGKTGNKKVQEITSLDKTIATEYIYKRQKLANEDIDNIREANDETRFVQWVQDELVRQTTNTIVKAIVCGDKQSGKDKITSFEEVGTKTVSDSFTYVSKVAMGEEVTFGDVWKMVRSLYNPDNKDVTLFIDKAVLAKIAEFKYTADGSAEFRGIDELKAKLGVAEIIEYDLHAYGDANLHAVAIIPDGYWVKTKRVIDVTYPIYEKNELNWQHEMNVGGKIHDLGSTAVLRQATE